jgi:hypothetical protein
MVLHSERLWLYTQTLDKPSLMLVGKARSHPRVEHLNGTLFGKALALHTNIKAVLFNVNG